MTPVSGRSERRAGGVDTMPGCRYVTDRQFAIPEMA